jgi:hypothetical protein
MSFQSVWRSSTPEGHEQTNILLFQCVLCVTCENSAGLLEYNFFQKLVRIIFIVASVSFTPKALLCSTDYFCIVQRVTCRLTTPRKCIVAFALQQWLAERATVLFYSTFRGLHDL